MEILYFNASYGFSCIDFDSTSGSRGRKGCRSPPRPKFLHWWLVELPMWLTDSFSVTFLEGGGDCVHTRESHTVTIHGN